ncbi:MAG TPA: MucR family transcriptional regulator [Candidatus Methylomirabilis sp.]|nr:MucR family transcriptional regulator [Candidatus Methylomirabilis sp.]
MSTPLLNGHPEARTGDWLNALRADPRRAIGEDAISCLICGRTFRQLTNTHLRAHGSEALEYKRRFGYNRGRPLMCHALQRLYAERAVRSRLAARIRARPILVRPELRRLGGARAIALEEWLTRRDARRKPDATSVPDHSNTGSSSVRRQNPSHLQP